MELTRTVQLNGDPGMPAAVMLRVQGLEKHAPKSAIGMIHTAISHVITNAKDAIGVDV